MSDKKTCSDCRFFQNNNCVRFNILVNENYIPCDGFAETTNLSESVNKIKLYD